MYHLIHSDVSPHFLNPKTYKCVVFSNSFETNSRKKFLLFFNLDFASKYFVRVESWFLLPFSTLYFLGSDSFYSKQEVFIIMTLGKTSYETIKEWIFKEYEIYAPSLIKCHTWKSFYLQRFYYYGKFTTRRFSFRI